MTNCKDFCFGEKHPNRLVMILFLIPPQFRCVFVCVSYFFSCFCPQIAFHSHIFVDVAHKLVPIVMVIWLNHSVLNKLVKHQFHIYIYVRWNEWMNVYNDITRSNGLWIRIDMLNTIQLIIIELVWWILNTSSTNKFPINLFA